MVKYDIYSPMAMKYKEEAAQSQANSYNKPVELMRHTMYQWEHFRDYINNFGTYDPEEEIIRDMLAFILKDKSDNWKNSHWIEILPYKYAGQIEDFYMDKI